MENQTVQDSGKNRTHTILLVEDFDDTRLMMKMWLSRRGYRVIEAETGYRAIAIEAGCDEYVSTPFEPNELAGLIESLIAARESAKPHVFRAND